MMSINYVSFTFFAINETVKTRGIPMCEKNPTFPFENRNRQQFRDLDLVHNNIDVGMNTFPQ